VARTRASLQRCALRVSSEDKEQVDEH